MLFIYFIKISLTLTDYHGAHKFVTEMFIMTWEVVL